MTFDHCASVSSSVEIADRGGSKLSDVTLPNQEGRNLLPKIQTFPADKYNIHRRTNPLWHPEQMEEGRTNFSEIGHFPRKVPYHIFFKKMPTEQYETGRRGLIDDQTRPRSE